MGQYAHRVIGTLLAAGERRPDPVTIWALVARHPVVALARSHPQAARQQLIGAASVYFAHFAPADGWELEGVEVRVPPVRFDLVWLSTDGTRLADEIKTGRAEMAVERAALETQVERELAAGRKKWAMKFAGVRVLILGAPNRSFLARPDGGREPLIPELGS